MSWHEYRNWLIGLGGFSKEKATELAIKKYKEQFGHEPEESKEEFFGINISDVSGTYQV